MPQISVVQAEDQKSVDEMILAVNQAGNMKNSYGDQSEEYRLAIKEIQRVNADNLRDLQFKADQRYAKVLDELKTARSQEKLKTEAYRLYQEQIKAQEAGDTETLGKMRERFNIINSLITETPLPADVQALQAFETREPGFESHEARVTARELLGGASRTKLDELRIAIEQNLAQGNQQAAQRLFNDLTDEEKNAMALLEWVDQGLISEDKVEDTLVDILTGDKESAMKSSTDKDPTIEDAPADLSGISDARVTTGIDNATRGLTAKQKNVASNEILEAWQNDLATGDGTVEGVTNNFDNTKLTLRGYALDQLGQADATGFIGVQEIYDGSVVLSELLADIDDSQLNRLSQGIENLSRLSGSGDPKLIELANTVEFMLSAFLKAQSGTAVTESEYNRIKKLFLSLGTNRKANESIIKTIHDFTSGKMTGMFQRRLGKDTGSWVFDTKALLLTPADVTESMIQQYMEQHGKSRQQAVRDFNEVLK